MGMNGTTYVNPGWKDGGPPALSAAELNAISDTLAGAQAKNTSQDALIAALQTAVGGKGQIAFGSYTGTGLYGADNPNIITFPFPPKVVWIYKAYTSTVADLKGCIVDMSTMGTSYTVSTGPVAPSFSSNPNNYGKKSSDGKTLSWYAGENRCQLNFAGAYNSSPFTYSWIAFA